VSTSPILCEICEQDFEGDKYGEENDCPTCGQRYAYDEGQGIVLTEEQISLLRAAHNTREGL
jgi:Zn finger protein HypA/HybF involved in hydrogenase expression